LQAPIVGPQRPLTDPKKQNHVLTREPANAGIATCVKNQVKCSPR
jgi:hypothetical protein